MGAIETVGDGVAIQRVSQRNPRATDFRVVQGALNADDVGNLLSGLAGTVPNTTYSSSIAPAEVTGIAARRVGVVIGVIFIVLAFFVLAFFPKVTALVIAIPAPVAAAYVTVLLGLLFVQGMRIVIQDGVDHRKAVIVELSFLVRRCLPERVGVSGTAGRRIPRSAAGQRHDLRRDRRGHNDGVHGADEPAAQALDGYPGHRRPAGTGGNASRARVEGRLAYMGETPDVQDGREISFRLLRHYASSVRHQKYHGVDIVTVNVDGPR